MGTKEITQKIIDKPVGGLIGFSAKLALNADRTGTFCKELHQQLTQDDPHNMRRILGDEISDAILNHFKD